MSDNVIGDIYKKFDGALSGLYEGAATGISGYVIPIAWILLGICLLIWCFLIIEGKVAMPITDWLLKFVGFMVVLYIMGNGYLNWVAKPIFDLPSALTSAMSNSPTNAPDLLGQVNEKVVDLVSAMFTAGSNLVKELAIGPAIALFLMGVLVIVATYLLLAVALFSIIFSKLGLSMVLAVGPFFVLALILPQTRQWFYSWLNTGLYFVFYHVFTALFIFMFIGIINGYVGTLNTTLGGTGGGGGVLNMVANLLGVRGSGLNVTAITIPILLISMAMFFMFLQIPTMCASLTGGSGGSFGAGLTNLTHAKSLLSRSRAK
ncbi:type IV secretion system protein [Variovorax rhizosphaerae]|uniref:Type IV secretion system protein n=1 Tax=Variovorax rhizosphaerae TaxID=1836200 RepID=A0ABU8WX75_9BURK